MCHGIGENIRAFVQSAAEAFALRGPVYQFGSCSEHTDAEIEPLHDCFSGTDYVSYQLDDNMPLGRLPFPDAAARTVLWLGPLGRTLGVPQAVVELRRVLAPGGALLIGMPGQMPTDQEAQVPKAQAAVHHVHALLAPLDLTLFGWQGVGSQPHVVYGLGFKPPLGGGLLRNATRFLERFPQRLQTVGGKAGWWQHLKALFDVKRDPCQHSPLRRTNLSQAGRRPRGRWFRRGRTSASSVEPETRAERQQSPPRTANCPVQFVLYMAANRSVDDGLLKAWLLGQHTGGRPDVMD